MLVKEDAMGMVAAMMNPVVVVIVVMAVVLIVVAVLLVEVISFCRFPGRGKTHLTSASPARQGRPPYGP